MTTQSAYRTDADRWLAVTVRNPRANGQFVYAVKTTGIFCRPICRSRRAKRENVEFFSSAFDALRAGYRPCKRCRPSDNAPVADHSALITRACRLLAQSETPVNIDALAAAANLSRSHFHRLFKSATGLTPKAYAAAHRAEQLRDALAQSCTVTSAIYRAGFNSAGRFYENAPKQLGMSPSAFRAGGRGATIRFAVGQCTLGAILVAASQWGICTISLGDDPQILLESLQDRFPNATLVGADPEFEKTVAQVIAHVDGPSGTLDLPLDIQGTAFQQRVWQELREIPCGQTRTYTQIAQSLGRPRAIRAVARACASNQIAIAIPCHRVIRTDGALSGYRWGIDRKAKLIAAEKSQTDRSPAQGQVQQRKTG